MKLKPMAFAFFTFALLLKSVFAGEWSVDAGSASFVDDNVYKNYSSYSDVYQSLYGAVHRDFGAESYNVRLHYNAGASFYRAHSERNFINHTLGAVWTLPRSDGNRIWNIGANGYVADYMDVFDIFDSRTVRGFANLRQKLSNWSYLTFGILGEVNSYPNVPQFDNSEVEFFSRWQAFLKTRTTVNLAFSYARENHFGNAHAGFDAGDVQYLNGEESGAPEKLRGELTLAQSLSDLTGINVSASYSYPVTACREYFVTTTGAVLTESDLFNDPFSYSMKSIGSQLTRMFREDLTVSVAGGLMRRDYHHQVVYDLEGEMVAPSMLRKDSRKYLSLTLGKTFYAGEKLGIGASLNYLTIRNDSNDPFYRYTNNVVNAALSFGF